MNALVQKPFAEVPRSVADRLLEAVCSPESDVQIWIAHLDSILPNDMGELMASLHPAEHARAAQFRYERERQHFRAARGILRYLLGTALNIPASALVFEYGSNGKPAVAAVDADEPALRFNISHAAGSAIFALAWDRNLGIDLEAIERLVADTQELSDLATRTLSSRELAIWHALPNEAARSYAFLRAWTRKEAYVKATGKGLFERLQDIEVGGDWAVHDLAVPAGFIAALAVEHVRP